MIFVTETECVYCAVGAEYIGIYKLTVSATMIAGGLDSPKKEYLC